MFTQLLTDRQASNQYCADCGYKMVHSRAPSSQDFARIFVSVNHGIFICENCALLHQQNYGVEVSFIKPIVDMPGGRTKQRWTYTQLRVLIISGGNRAFRDYMEQYELMSSETIQNRYNTQAA